MKKLTLFFSLALVCSAGTGTHHPKLADELTNAAPQAQYNVIVQWQHKPTDVHHQKVVNLGGSIRRRTQNLNATSYSVPASALAGLANDPDVAYVAPDRTVYARLDYTAAAVNAPAAWNAGLNGSGIGVAVIDSGLNYNMDLMGHVVYNQDFTNPALAAATAIASSYIGGYMYTGIGSAPDLFGHGEHVAGIIAASGYSSSCSSCSRSLKGMAPGVNIVNLRVLDQNGIGTDSAVIAAIDQAISLASTYNIRVINLSLGRPVYESYRQDPLCQAVEQAWKAGIVVVVAAGNDGRDTSMGTNGYGTISAPGNDPYVITVGAMKAGGTNTRTDDLIASYSSKGPSLIDAVVKPDLVAPGNQVVSLLGSTTQTLAVQNPANNVLRSYYQHTGNTKPGNTFFMLSGTSMATPVVSGAAALLLQANPALTPDQVKAKLMLTAYKTFPASSVATEPTTGQTYVSYYDIFTVGAGYLDIAAALADKSLAAGTAMSPYAVYDPSTSQIGLVTDPSSVWNLNTVWGVQSVYDVQTVWGVNNVSAARTTWGVNTVWGVNTIWGVQTVWGASADHDDVHPNQTIWGAGINLNAPITQTLSNGKSPVVSASTTNQSTAMTVIGKGEN